MCKRARARAHSRQQHSACREGVPLPSTRAPPPPPLPSLAHTPTSPTNPPPPPHAPCAQTSAALSSLQRPRQRRRQLQPPRRSHRACRGPGGATPAAARWPSPPWRWGGRPPPAGAPPTRLTAWRHPSRRRAARGTTWPRRCRCVSWSSTPTQTYPTWWSWRARWRSRSATMCSAATTRSLCSLVSPPATRMRRRRAAGGCAEGRAGLEQWACVFQARGLG